MKELIRRKFTSFSNQIISVLIDTVFLGFWLIIQWLFEKYILPSFAPVDSIHSWVYCMFQIIFALTTLYPILLYIYVDIVAISIEAMRTIKKMKSKNE